MASQPLRRAGGVRTAGRGGVVSLARGEVCSETKAELRARVPESQDRRSAFQGCPCLCAEEGRGWHGGGQVPEGGGSLQSGGMAPGAEM